MRFSKKVLGFMLALIMAFSTLTVTVFTNADEDADVTVVAEEGAEEAPAEEGEDGEDGAEEAPAEEAPAAAPPPPPVVAEERETTSTSIQAQKIAPTGVATPAGARDYALTATVGASSSSNWEFHGPDQATNNDMSNNGFSRWISDSTKEDWWEIDGKKYAWFSIDLGVVQTVNRLTIVERANTDVFPNGRVNSWIVETSVDYNIWTEVASGGHLAGSTSGNMLRSPFDIDFVPIQARYVEIFMEYNPQVLAAHGSIQLSRVSLYNTLDPVRSESAEEPAATTDSNLITPSSNYVDPPVSIRNNPETVHGNANAGEGLGGVGTDLHGKITDITFSNNDGYIYVPNDQNDLALGRPVNTASMTKPGFPPEYAFDNIIRIGNDGNAVHRWVTESAAAIASNNNWYWNYPGIPAGNYVKIGVKLDKETYVDRVSIVENAAASWDFGKVGRWFLAGDPDDYGDDDVIMLASGFGLSHGAPVEGNRRAPYVIDFEPAFLRDVYLFMEFHPDIMSATASQNESIEIVRFAVFNISGKVPAPPPLPPVVGAGNLVLNKPVIEASLNEGMFQGENPTVQRITNGLFFSEFSNVTFDGTSTVDLPGKDGKWGWFIIDLERVTTFDQMVFYERATRINETVIWPNGRITNWFAEVSDDNITYTEIGSGTHLSEDTGRAPVYADDFEGTQNPDLARRESMRGPFAVDFDEPVSGRYFKLYMQLNTTQGNTNFQVQGLELLNSASANDPTFDLAAGKTVTSTRAWPGDSQGPQTAVTGGISWTNGTNDFGQTFSRWASRSPNEHDNHEAGNNTDLSWHHGGHNGLPAGKYAYFHVDLGANMTFDTFTVWQSADPVAFPNGRAGRWVIMTAPDGSVYNEETDAFNNMTIVARGTNLVNDATSLAYPERTTLIRAPYEIKFDVVIARHVVIYFEYLFPSAQVHFARVGIFNSTAGSDSDAAPASFTEYAQPALR